GAPAVARGPGPLAGARPGEGIVAPLARDGVRPHQDPAPRDDPAARPGPEDHAEDEGEAGPRAVLGLREGEAVGVVGQADLAPEAALEVLPERSSVQPGAVGVLDGSGGRRDRPRHADPDRASPAQAGLETLDQAGDGGDGRVVVVAGSGDARPPEDVA